MFKIPFSWLPFSWGMTGRTREIAEAEYLLEGFDLELKLLTLRQDELEMDDYKRKIADLELKYKRVDEEHYHRCLADLIKDPIQKELAVTELDKREGKLTDLEYAKKIATLKDEPWVTVIDMNFSKSNSLEGSFELDWNQPFVDKLTAEGYTGPTPDNIVNQWFMELCRNIAMEEFDGNGDFTADSAANLETMKRWSSEKESFGKGRKGYK